MDRSAKRRLKVFKHITRDMSPNYNPPGFPETYSEFNSCSHLSFSSNSSIATEGFKSMDFSFLDAHQPGALVSAPADFSQSSFSSTLYSNIFPSANPSKANYLNPGHMSTEDSSREEQQERGRPKKRPLYEEEKNFYVINLDKVKEARDLRTTIMIKNIPNKYTQKMLLSAINKNFAGSYNFLYLPIDFKVTSN